MPTVREQIQGMILVEVPSFRVVVKQASDFPTPDINGFIQLVDYTTYQINGTVSGDFKFICGIKNSFVGIDRVNDKLLSTSTGVMFDMDGTTTTKSNILFSDLTIGLQMEHFSMWSVRLKIRRLV